MDYTKPFSISYDIDYSINVLISTDQAKRIELIQSKLADRLKDKLWLMPSSAMHITIMDWISFFAHYDRDKQSIFEEGFNEYDSVLTKLLTQLRPFNVEFTEIKATPDAIILIGKDNGSIQKIRKEFTTLVKLQPQTNPPPSIIHSTIARFKQAFPLKDAEQSLPLVKDIRIDIKEFCLHKFVTAPVQDLELIKTYPL